jgi:Cu+-exporting ATPase
VAIVPNASYNAGELIRLAASLERGSEHPLAAAIVGEALEKSLIMTNPRNFETFPGYGVSGNVEGLRVALGNTGLLEKMGIKNNEFIKDAANLRKDGQTVMFVIIEGHVQGLIGVADPIKSTSINAVKSLLHEGIRIVMVTGDSLVTANTVARKLGIDSVLAEVLPVQKAKIIKNLRLEGRVIAMAGDGINDAPALSQADVGIAMGNGSDIAKQSASITLVKGDLRAIAKAFRLSKATMQNIRQNLFFAFFYNMIGIPIAAGLLYPFLGIVLSPMFAAAAMSLSSVSVISNALRLRSVKL